MYKDIKCFIISMYEEEIMAITIMGIVFVIHLLCVLIILFRNLCINRRNSIDRIEVTNDYLEI